MTKSSPDQEIDYLRECFDYFPESGLLVWKSRPERHFATLGGMRNANTRMAGRVVSIPDGGYLKVRVSGVPYLVHRIAFAIFHGVWPETVDHIDGNTLNNRISNLRDVCQRENARNMARYRRVTTLLTGVFWHSKQQRWHAYIGSSGALERLGSHTSLFEAVCARKSAEIRHGFHINHGRQPICSSIQEVAA